MTKNHVVLICLYKQINIINVYFLDDTSLFISTPRNWRKLPIVGYFLVRNG